MKPLCFVLMPFGNKKDAKGREIDFNMIYDELIKPAIMTADMEPIRADEEMVGGIIHKPMFERLLMCEYAIADLTTANANVFYELGVRHASKPYSTLSIFASDCTLPFDVQMLRAYPYSLDEKRALNNVEKDMQNLTKWLNEARTQKTDSPLYQFFDDLRPHFIPHEKTDVFREQVKYSNEAKKTLAQLRREKNKSGLKEFESNLKIADTEGGILIDLFLSYRALEAWDEMIDLTHKIPDYLAHSLMVREQLGLALNRLKRGYEAETVLKEALDTYGANSETYGILGRVYKDRWKDENDPFMKEVWLKEAINTYLKGFESDCRDAYPGINAITLMHSLEKPDPRLDELVCVVRYAVKQKIAYSEPDYWDLATLMELEIMSHNANEAKALLQQALLKASEAFMPKTTLDTLVMLRNKWNDDEISTWLEPFITVLVNKYDSLTKK